MSRTLARRTRISAAPSASGIVSLMLATAMAILLSGCGGTSGNPDPADTLSTRERQEAIGRSGLPGATGINRALEIADTATARQAELDSLIRSR